MRNFRWKSGKAKQGRRILDMKVALITGHTGRFTCYGSRSIKTMWMMYDRKTDTTYFLYGNGWEEARENANSRIRGIVRSRKKA
jgi:hypothetical protein